MYVSTSEIVQKANSIVAQCGTRDPLRIARDLGIEVMYYPFNEQRGAYKVLMRNRFIFVKNDLHPVSLSSDLEVSPAKFLFTIANFSSLLRIVYLPAILPPPCL